MGSLAEATLELIIPRELYTVRSTQIESYFRVHCLIKHDLGLPNSIA
jgi:hypothetical protein